MYLYVKNYIFSKGMSLWIKNQTKSVFNQKIVKIRVTTNNSDNKKHKQHYPLCIDTIFVVLIFKIIL